MKIGHIPERLGPVPGPRYQPIKSRGNPFPAGAHPSGSPQTPEEEGPGDPLMPNKGVHERISAPLLLRDRSSHNDFPGNGEKWCWRSPGWGWAGAVLVWHLRAGCPSIECPRVSHPGAVSHDRCPRIAHPRLAHLPFHVLMSHVPALSQCRVSQHSSSHPGVTCPSAVVMEWRVPALRVPDLHTCHSKCCCRMSQHGLSQCHTSQDFMSWLCVPAPPVLVSWHRVPALVCR